MSRLYNNFNFVGELVLPNDDEKIYTKESFDSGWDKHRLSIGIRENELNAEFLTIEGFHSEKHTTYVYGMTKGLHGSKRESIRINWEDRLDEDVVDKMAGFTKYIVDLEEDQDLKDEYMEIYYKIISLENKEDPSDEDIKKLEKYKEEFNEKAKNRYEFLHQFDMVMFLKSVLPMYRDKKFRATGNIELSEYKGNIYTNYVPRVLEIVPEDYKNELRSTVDIYFNKDSIDDSSFDDDKKVYIHGYLQSRDNKVKEDRFFPRTFIIDGTNLDFEKDIHKQYFEYVKNSFKVSGRNYFHLQCEVSVYKGAELVSITYDDLTDNQKMEVDLGISKLTDFVDKKAVGGYIDELRVIKPITKGQFADGAVDTDMRESEFQELIVIDTSDVDLEDLQSEKANKNESSKEVEEESDDEVIEDLGDFLAQL